MLKPLACVFMLLGGALVVAAQVNISWDGSTRLAGRWLVTSVASVIACREHCMTRLRISQVEPLGWVL